MKLGSMDFESKLEEHLSAPLANTDNFLSNDPYDVSDSSESPNVIYDK